VFLAVMTAVMLTASACSKLTRNPVPLDRTDRAQPAGLPDVRAHWDERGFSPVFQAETGQAWRSTPFEPPPSDRLK
jgi:hypothetical protein